MSFSLNEVEAMAKRATRGAGDPWGVAEEASKATRWLCARGLDGCGVLAGLLARDFCADLGAHSPRDLAGDWQGDETLCPIMAGAALSDRSEALRSGSVQMAEMAFPVFLMPFAAGSARALDGVLTVECDTWRGVTDGDTVALSGTDERQTGRVRITLGGRVSERHPQFTRATPDTADWAVLQSYAQKTYAPATEQSRLLGAGAGVSDND